jgi:glycosyltransferase involved in cell wall biosynthesis
MHQVAQPDRQILIIFRSLRHGGTEKCSLELAQAFIEQGYTVHLALLDPVYEMTPPTKVHIHEVGSRVPDTVQSWLEAFHRDNKLSLIIATDTYIPLQLANIEIYYTLHIIPTERIDGGFLRQLKKRRSWRRRLKDKNIIAISEGVYSDVTNILKARPRSIRVIANTFNFLEIEASSHQTPDYQLPEKYLLYVGRLSAVKRLDRLLRIYKGLTTDLPLVILGDGDQYQNLQQITADMDLSREVIFAGWQDNPYPAIANAQALLLTSDSESFSAILVEALYLNTPVISTDCLGPKEIMGAELKQFIVKKEDEAGFSQTIQQVIEHGQPAVKNQLLDRYNFKAIVKQFEALMPAD